VVNLSIRRGGRTERLQACALEAAVANLIPVEEAVATDRRLNLKPGAHFAS
jgi:hypothetical protein